MPIYDQEDVIAWTDASRVICAGCGDPGGAKPMTKDDFTDDAIVVCDNCQERVL